MTHERTPNEDEWERLGPAEAIQPMLLQDEEIGVDDIGDVDLDVDEDAALADEEPPPGTDPGG